MISHAKKFQECAHVNAFPMKHRHKAAEKNTMFQESAQRKSGLWAERPMPGSAGNNTMNKGTAKLQPAAAKILQGSARGKDACVILKASSNREGRTRTITRKHKRVQTQEFK